MTSQWPPSAHSVLKVLGFGLCAAITSVGSWVLLSHISSQVVQAKNTQAIQTVQIAVAGNDERSRKMEEMLHGINLTTQRLTDMAARHDTAILEIKSDQRIARRRR